MITFIKDDGDTFYVGLEYPRCEGNPKKVEVELLEVRAADGILIEYDFDRDGYSIKQASTFSWHDEDTVMDPDWQEVAFIEAWARRKECDS